MYTNNNLLATDEQAMRFHWLERTMPAKSLKRTVQSSFSLHAKSSKSSEKLNVQCFVVFGISVYCKSHTLRPYIRKQFVHVASFVVNKSIFELIIINRKLLQTSRVLDYYRQ